MKGLLYIFKISGVFFITFSSFSCKKYLDAKPDAKLVVPNNVQDLQKILDYYPYMNTQCTQADEIASDNYYIKDNDYLALSADRMRSAYIWGSGIFTGMSPSDWQREYNVIYYANIVLENIGNITREATNSADWDNCMGQALVFRSKSFLEIVQTWAKAYDSTTETTDQGIPLRLTSNFNIPSVRASLKESYNQIISDLNKSIPLLPNHPLFIYRPSKPAAYGLLARTYLSMRKYNEAKKYADSCLQISGTLYDYNNLNYLGNTYPFSPLEFSNPEDILHSVCYSSNFNIKKAYGRIDTTLYKSYADNDLRKVVFFKNNGDNTYYFTGSYDGNSSSLNYNGIATDEMYLIIAECLARTGDTNGAMDKLNSLLVNRWKTGTFIPFIAGSSSDALNQILVERRKELIYRELRFIDIKRLNKEGANITLKRIIKGQLYTLPPNDPRYALPIPDNVIQSTAIQQN